MSDFDIPTSEIVNRMKKYHNFQDERMKKRSNIISVGSKLGSFKGKELHRLDLNSQKRCNWYERSPKNDEEGSIDTLKRSEKSKLNEYKQNLKQLEFEKDRKEKEELKKRLSNAYKVKNVSRISPSRVVSFDESYFEKISIPIDEENPISPTSFKTQVKVKLLNGLNEKVQFQTENKLKDLLDYVIYNNKEKDESYLTGVSLTNSGCFPPKKYNINEIMNLSLKKAGLCNGYCSIIKDTENGYVMKEGEYEQLKYEVVKLPNWKLKGDSHDEKERFSKKMENRRLSECTKDNKLKKTDLKRIRKQIEYDKKKRKEQGRRKKINKKRKFSNDQMNEQKNKANGDGNKNNDDKFNVLIQIRLPNGGRIEKSFKLNQKLSNVNEYLINNNLITNDIEYVFVIPFPIRKTFNRSIFNQIKISDLQLFPKGLIFVQIKK